MLDFQRGWLPQILGFAAMIADGELESAWTRGTPGRVRAASFDELYEQVFDDLQAEAMLRELAAHLPGQVERQELIASFLRALAHMRLQAVAFPELLEPRRLFASRSWLHLRGAAEALRQAFREHS